MAWSPLEQDLLRLRIFDDVEIMADRHGGYIPRDELLTYSIDGVPLALIDYSRGIRNPEEFNETLSILDSLNGPYSDELGDDGVLRYSFRTGDAAGGDNRKLRNAMVSQKPLILFRKPIKNIYVPILPAYVIGEDAANRCFLVATNEASWRAQSLGSSEPTIDKRYVAQVVQRRVHQPVFRAQVIIAYDTTCAICRLRHAELLDAAHIVADRSEGGIAHVTNGLALCKIHHASYDNDLIGISPDYKVHVNRALLAEVDGPMLKHGIQEMHGVSLHVPARGASRPSKDALGERFAKFSAR